MDSERSQQLGLRPKTENLSGNTIHTTGDDTGDIPKKRGLTGVRWYLVLLSIFSTNLLYGLDTTIAADLQAAVSETFDNVTQLGWLGVGFGLGSTIAILPLGKAYAILDTKWLFISCLTMFAAGSALCGAAPSMSALIVGRVWAGAGGAGMYLGTLVFITTVASPHEQAFLMGFEGFVYGGGCILGPIVGGLLADSAATWRWAFYLNLVIFGVMSPIYVFAIPAMPRRTDLSWDTKLRRLDWLGILLSSGLIAFSVVAVTSGGAVWNWSDGKFIALITLAGACLLLFVLTQYHAVFTTTSERLFPGEFLKHPQLVLLYLAMSAGGAALFIAVYYIPFYFLFVHGESGTEAAVRLLPFVSFYVTSILVCGYFMPRVGYHWLWYLVSGLFLTAGGAAMYTITASTPASHTYGFSVLLGFGLTVSQAGYAVASHQVEKARVPAVLQFMNFAQGSSQMMGLVIASAIFQSEAFDGLKIVLRHESFSDSEVRQAIAGSRSVILQKVDPELRALCIDVIVDTIRKEYILVVAAGALLSACSFFLTKKRYP